MYHLPQSGFLSLTVNPECVLYHYAVLEEGGRFMTADQVWTAK